MTKKNAVSVNRLTKIYTKNSTNLLPALNNLNSIEQNPLTAPVGKPSLFLERGGSA